MRGTTLAWRAVRLLRTGRVLSSTIRSARSARRVLALHAVALCSVTGEPLARASGFSQVLEVALAVYSVAVFATLAGSVGAYFLRADHEQPRAGG